MRILSAKPLHYSRFPYRQTLRCKALQGRERFFKLYHYRTSADIAYAEMERGINALNNAALAGNAEGAKEKIDAAVTGYLGRWEKTTEALKETGAADGDVAKLDKLRQRAAEKISRAAERYAAQAEKVAAARAAVKEIEQAEPQEPPEAELLDEPEEIDPRAYDTEEAFDEAYDAWEKEVEKVDAENARREAEYEAAYKEHTAEYLKWEPKQQRAIEKADDAAERLGEHLDTLTDAITDAHDELGEELGEVRDALLARIDEEEEADEEPEEIDEEETEEEPEEDEDEKRAGAAVVKAVAPSGAQGCAPETDSPAAVMLRDFPDVRQPNHYACGAASGMACGLWRGVGPKTISEWEKALGTTVERSTRPTAIVNYLRELGLSVEARDGMTVEDLRAATEAGNPVIVCVQDYGPAVPAKAEWPYGHYLTVLCVSHGMVMCQDSSLDNVEHEPGGDVPRSEASKSGNISQPGRIMVPVDRWMEAWYDVDESGRQYIQHGIIVGPRPRV